MTIWDIFNIPKPGTARTGSPGAGPAAGDVVDERGTQQQKPGFLGGESVAPVASGNRPARYGGTGDPVEVVSTVPGARDIPSDRGIGYATHGPPTPLVPRYSSLYDQLRTRDAWKNVVTNYAIGTIVQPTGNASAISAITFVNGTNSLAANLRTSQYPGAIQAYPVILSFSFAPVAATATGVQSFTIVPTIGAPIPLGVYTASAQAVENFTYILDGVLTDPGTTTIGTLVCTGNTLATPVTIVWQLTFGFAYLTPDPAMRGYVQDSPDQIAMDRLDAAARIRRN